MKFRSKPKIIEAYRLDLSKQHPPGVLRDPRMESGLFVRTIHGDKIGVWDGDWIITEPDGVHHYPCKPDIFNNSYEPIED